MRKRDLEKLLVQAVADALGIELNTPHKTAKPAARGRGKSETESAPRQAAA